jgi:hypothetical protein
VLGSVEGGTNNCVRQGAKESGQICISYKQFELGNFDICALFKEYFEKEGKEND